MVFSILLIILSIYSFYSIYSLNKKKNKVVSSLLSKYRIREGLSSVSGESATSTTANYKALYRVLRDVSIVLYGSENVKKNLIINSMLVVFATVIVSSKFDVAWYLMLVINALISLCTHYLMFVSKKHSFLLNDLIMTITVFNGVISSGRSINEAFKACGDVGLPSILKYEYQLMSPLIDRGYDIDNCIKAISLLERFPYPEFAFFFSTLSLNVKRGGALSEPLSKIRKILDDKILIDKEVNRLTAEARTSMKVLIALPFFFIGMMYFTQKENFNWLFHSSLGNLIFMLCSLVILCGIGFNYKMISKATRF